MAWRPFRSASKRRTSNVARSRTLTKGREALDRIAAGERFDVILSDLMMPDVTGMDLYDQLSISTPDQATRMVFLTGGAFTDRAREFLERVPNPRGEKPFDVSTILAMIAGVLRR